jgi:hypothetical protein
MCFNIASTIKKNDMKNQSNTKTYLSNNNPEFRIFKKGMTNNGPVIVLSRNDEPFDKVAKMEFYKMLGYSILPL